MMKWYENDWFDILILLGAAILAALGFMLLFLSWKGV